MSAQANYLSSSQASDAELQLAGDTNHPFNEYLLVLIEMGIKESFYCYFCYSPSFGAKCASILLNYWLFVAIALFSCFPIHSNMLSFGLCPYIVCRRWLKICLCCEK